MIQTYLSIMDIPAAKNITCLHCTVREIIYIRAT